MTRGQAKSVIVFFLLLAPGSLFIPWLATPFWLLSLPGTVALALRLNRDRRSEAIESVAGYVAAIALMATLFIQLMTLAVGMLR